MRNADSYEYDIALSFAGEDRHVAERLAELLRFHGIRVFYDRHEQDKLLGKDLYQYLQQVYRDAACFCVVLVSQAYASRLWTRHELKQAQARAFLESREYILPLRLDDTEVPGINATIGYIDLRGTTLESVADIMVRKVTETRDYRTWHLTPTSMDEFSPKLRNALDQVVGQVASELEQISARNKDEIPVLTADDRERLNALSSATGLDIETIVIDDGGVYIHHPWPDLIGCTVQSQWMYREGFVEWQIEVFRHLQSGYLTWKDRFASNPELEVELLIRRQEYQRRTLVGFRRLQLRPSLWWNIAVEAHEVAALGERAIFHITTGGRRSGYGVSGD